MPRLKNCLTCLEENFTALLMFLCCSCLVHLSRGGAQVSMFAPDVDQMHVIDHTKGAPQEGEKRCVCLPVPSKMAVTVDSVGPVPRLVREPFLLSFSTISTSTGPGMFWTSYTLPISCTQLIHKVYLRCRRIMDLDLAFYSLQECIGGIRSYRPR